MMFKKNLVIKSLILFIVFILGVTVNIYAATKPDIHLTKINGSSVSTSATVTLSQGDSFSFYIEVETNGDEITLNIKVKGGANVYGAALEITYDSAKISYISSSKGNYLGTNVDYFASLYNNQQGILLIGTGKTGNVPGANGDGSLCTVVFKALAIQTDTPIQFNNTNSCLKSPVSNISGTLWLGGVLSYQ